MKSQKRFTALFLAMLLLFSAGMRGYAHEAPDLSRQGSISVTMTYDQRPVPGGALSLYRVGAVEENNGNYSFVLTGEFAGSRADLTDLSSAGLAEKLAEYAGAQKLSGISEKIGEDGTVCFSGLEPGLYLLVQTESAAGYYKADPFLVSVPANENGSYLYDVDAGPKLELEREPDTPDKPGKPDKPGQPSNPGEPSNPSENPSNPAGPTLPQTGQLNWPIPILAILGLLLFSMGWALRFGQKRNEYEK